MLLLLLLVACFCFGNALVVPTTANDDDKDASSNNNHSNNNDNDASSSSSSSSSSYLLLCLTDGSIYSVSAWTGAYQSSIATDPLLQTHRAAKTAATATAAEDDDDMVLPGLDGRLYWRPPRVDDDDDGGGVQPALQELPLTVHALLENPVRSCDPSDETATTGGAGGGSGGTQLSDCGILTAEAVTSLLALTDSGQLLWRTQPGTSSSSSSHAGDSANSNDNNNILLLQRKDYWVQHVLAATGVQSWNVSLGTYQALDFELPTDDDADSRDEKEKLLLDDDDDMENDSDGTASTTPTLPAVIFSNQGRTLTAIDPRTTSILWRQHVPSIVSAVFGIAAGQWKTVAVVTTTEEQEQYYNNNIEKHPLLLPALPSHHHHHHHHHHGNTRESEIERFLWMQQQQRWAGNQQQQYYNNFQSQEKAGLPSSDAVATAATFGSTQEKDLCLINGAIVEGTCPNLYAPRPHQLHLPSPSMATTITAKTSVTPVPEGLLLSWSLVTFLVVALVVAGASVRFWYVRKKAKWLTQAASVVRRDRSSSLSLRNKNNSDGSSSGGGGDAPKLKRSSSLPGILGTPDPLPQLALVPPPTLAAAVPKSDDGTRPLQQQQQTSGLEGGTALPLVRYSRYASEFIELRALGKGGFGSVVQCKNALDGRDYAVKKVSIRGTSDGMFQQQLERVLREVKILAVLDHPNIVRYYTAWMEIDDAASTIAGDAASSTNHTMTAHDDLDVGNFSRCYSSSLLLDTDSVSGWDVAARNNKNNTTAGNNNYYSNYNPLMVEGWNNTGFEMSSETSDGGASSSSTQQQQLFMPKRRSLKHSSSDLMVFAEDSNEEKEACDSAAPAASKSEIAAEESSSRQENTSPFQRSLSLGNPSDSLFSRKTTTLAEASSSLPTATTAHSSANLRHTLYIQMQLCSHKTVAEFLADAVARRGPDSTTTGVDIPKALRLFLQIAEAVKHVHSHSLIHRDLKPQNCFLDDSGSTVKVGDFGLSRESSLTDGAGDDAETVEGSIASLQAGGDRAKKKNASMDADFCNDDHTAGVGTRSYASPEQMNGSAYDSSTDVYSLGIMLFELLYPMYTGMERNICLSRLRNQIFPSDWEDTVGKAFPSLRGLIIGMLSVAPSARPTAESVARHIQSILGEFTILSLDTQHYNDSNPDVVLLRVEAEHRDDALPHTMQLIRDESIASGYPVEIVQYGLRSSSSNNTSGEEPATAIMEFALKFNSDTAESSPPSRPPPSAPHLVNKLRSHPEIYKARQVVGRSVSEALSSQS